MKKLLALLFSLFLFYSPSVFADDISDFQIEGISVGDSLLDYMTKDEILDEIEAERDSYFYLNEPNKYSTIYLIKDFSVYDALTFIIKNNSSNMYLTNKDETYTILSIRGVIVYDDDFNGCLQKRDEIEEVFSEMLLNSYKTESNFPKSDDRSGRSIIDVVDFKYKEDLVRLSCTDYEKTFKIKNNIVDTLNVHVRSEEVRRWLNDE